MCGIVGYVGDEQAAPILLTGLSKLEYRGYDSAGIAVRNEATDKIAIVKAKGRLKTLIEKTDGGSAVPGTCGIGHTRWATHGEPSETNAHPHCTDDKSVVLVHNGIIENYQELKAKLLRSGYTFYSQTDTEVAVKLVDYYYKKTGTPVGSNLQSNAPYPRFLCIWCYFQGLSGQTVCSPQGQSADHWKERERKPYRF